MDQAIPDCLVMGYEDLVDGLELPDPEDRHVLAAAICNREVIRARSSAHRSSKYNLRSMQ